MSDVRERDERTSVRTPTEGGQDAFALNLRNPSCGNRYSGEYP